MIAHPKGGKYRSDDPGEPTTGVPRVSIADDEVELLASLVVGLRVLEIGTGLGVSAKAMAKTAAEVVTVDVDEWVHANIWPLLPRNVRGFTSLAEVEGLFDAVFIDGDHSRHAVKRDVEQAEQFAPGGLLIAHDANVVLPFLPGDWEFHPTTYGVATRRLP
jgi:predicted O-methyltransferase YrrM